MAAEAYLRIQLGVVLIQFFCQQGNVLLLRPSKSLAADCALALVGVSEDVNPLVHEDSELVLHI